MTNLKTLKDMNEYCLELVSLKTLKAEAIKWVKAYPKHPMTLFIKFFNLTEEEMK